MHISHDRHHHLVIIIGSAAVGQLGHHRSAMQWDFAFDYINDKWHEPGLAVTTSFSTHHRLHVKNLDCRTRWAVAAGAAVRGGSCVMGGRKLEQTDNAMAQKPVE